MQPYLCRLQNVNFLFSKNRLSLPWWLFPESFCGRMMFDFWYLFRVTWIQNITSVETSPEAQWLRLSASTAGGAGSIPGLGTKIPHAMWHGQNKNKQNYSICRNRSKYVVALKIALLIYKKYYYVFTYSAMGCKLESLSWTGTQWLLLLNAELWSIGDAKPVYRGQSTGELMPIVGCMYCKWFLLSLLFVSCSAGHLHAYSFNSLPVAMVTLNKNETYSFLRWEFPSKTDAGWWEPLLLFLLCRGPKVSGQVCDHRYCGSCGVCLKSPFSMIR